MEATCQVTGHYWRNMNKWKKVGIDGAWWAWVRDGSYEYDLLACVHGSQCLTVVNTKKSWDFGTKYLKEGAWNATRSNVGGVAFRLKDLVIEVLWLIKCDTWVTQSDMSLLATPHPSLPSFIIILSFFFLSFLNALKKKTNLHKIIIIDLIVLLNY